MKHIARIITSKISKFTKFCYVWLQSDQDVTCQRSSKSIQTLYFFRIVKAFYMVALQRQNLEPGKLLNFNVIFLVTDRTPISD